MDAAIISGDDSLLVGLRDGDERAFRGIIKKYLHALRYYAWTLVKNRESAEEVTNDAFTKLWQARQKFGSMLEIKRFLYVVVKHACFDYLKSMRAKWGRHTDEADELMGNEPDSEAKLIRAELMDAIYREINNLPDKQREVFRLSVLEGLAAEEIGMRLGITLNAVYLNKSLATKSLQKIFKGQSFFLYLCFLAFFGEN